MDNIYVDKSIKNVVIAVVKEHDTRKQYLLFKLFTHELTFLASLETCWVPALPYFSWNSSITCSTNIQKTIHRHEPFKAVILNSWHCLLVQSPSDAKMLKHFSFIDLAFQQPPIASLFHLYFVSPLDTAQ